MDGQSEFTPGAMARWQVYARARELAALAGLAVELAVSGPGQDVPRALAQFERMRAVLGRGAAGGRGE